MPVTRSSVAGSSTTRRSDIRQLLAGDPGHPRRGAACVGGAAAVEAARRSRNWLWLICAVGLAAVVIGVVGQRAVPSGSDTSGRSGSIWDASVSLPGSGIQVTPVAVGGFLLAAAGLSLVLFL